MEERWWHIVKFENGVLTTVQHQTYRDFVVRDDGLVDVIKHFGDHEWESVGEVGDWVWDRTTPVINTLIAAAQEVYKGYRWEKGTIPLEPIPPEILAGRQ